MESRDQLFQQLLAEHSGGVSRVAATYARGIGEREDLTQEIWLAVWRALPAFRGEASLKTFVYRIAHNRSVSALVRRRPPGDALQDAEEPEDPTPGPAQQYAALRDAQSLLAAVQKLPLGLRQTLSLRLEGLSYEEIAEVLGVSESNVAVRLNRARQRLSARLTREE
ncbi:RNA polymerase sigma factor [Microbulbifer sp. TYP-18]|uniref:RNA polymerase sigma factor n=1 Tax=Microbulbifer sp. TYP-18 TaxID=3230024 RepID=UPI0034C63758